MNGHINSPPGLSRFMAYGSLSRSALAAPPGPTPLRLGLVKNDCGPKRECQNCASSRPSSSVGSSRPGSSPVPGVLEGHTVTTSHSSSSSTNSDNITQSSDKITFVLTPKSCAPLIYKSSALIKPPIKQLLAERHPSAHRLTEGMFSISSLISWAEAFLHLSTSFLNSRHMSNGSVPFSLLMCMEI
ncbi:hypothetical protein DPX16_9752 [Anabarilius grahami]|uniref:Uncharacterized protein n=1 Tax=Anabarilius grahami TaxID=495550 RepID=A0A3N0Y4U4_ANAGA|nr:hypothetical protein DPX16_9752 [Anabarilius grahami]